MSDTHEGGEELVEHLASNIAMPQQDLNVRFMKCNKRMQHLHTDDNDRDRTILGFQWHLIHH